MPYLGLAAMAVLSIAVAPSKGGAITETLRLTSMAVLYLAAYAVIRDRRGLLTDDDRAARLADRARRWWRCGSSTTADRP